jgi:hypothetical protein
MELLLTRTGVTKEVDFTEDEVILYDFVQFQQHKKL